MTDREIINKAKILFAGTTQGDITARLVIDVAENSLALLVRSLVQCLDCYQHKPYAEYGGSIYCAKCRELRLHFTAK